MEQAAKSLQQMSEIARRATRVPGRGARQDREAVRDALAPPSWRRTRWQGACSRVEQATVDMAGASGSSRSGPRSAVAAEPASSVPASQQQLGRAPPTRSPRATSAGQEQAAQQTQHSPTRLTPPHKPEHRTAAGGTGVFALRGAGEGAAKGGPRARLVVTELHTGRFCGRKNLPVVQLGNKRQLGNRGGGAGCERAVHCVLGGTQLAACVRRHARCARSEGAGRAHVTPWPPVPAGFLGPGVPPVRVEGAGPRSVFIRPEGCLIKAPAAPRS